MKIELKIQQNISSDKNNNYSKVVTYHDVLPLTFAVCSGEPVLKGSHLEEVVYVLIRYTVKHNSKSQKGEHDGKNKSRLNVYNRR
jgi:hypothetical protein